MKPRKLDIPEIEQIPFFMKVIDDLDCGNNVFLVGSAGTGKTTIAEKVAYARRGLKEDGKGRPPFAIINCNQWTSPVDVKGGQTIEGYKEGAMITAWREGLELILDEMPKLDPNTAGLLNDALAKSAKKGAIIFDGRNEPVRKHDDFGCIATGNVLGKGLSGNYVGNNKQDASLLDRFSACTYHIGFNEGLESQLIYPTVLKICWDIRKAILKYESKDEDDDETEDIISLRTMLNLQRGYELEMMREFGLSDPEGNRYDRVLNGKTLRDGLESIFYTMTKDKANKIKADTGIEGFYNSYKGRDQKDLFVNEYQRRSKSSL
jgi:MoxR-like ATPase